MNSTQADSSPAQEAAHILRRKEIWAEMNSVRISDETPRAVGRPKAFETDLAEVSKTSRSVAFQKTKRAEELGADIHRIAGTSLDKGVEMDALIKLPPDTRAELIDRASKGEKVSARPAPPAKAAEEDQFRALCRAWGDANGGARMRFLEWAGLSRH